MAPAAARNDRRRSHQTPKERRKRAIREKWQVLEVETGTLWRRLLIAV